MRILYLTQYFPPEVGATQARAYENARGLSELGHQVTIITEIPNHPSGVIPANYQGRLYEHTEEDGIEVIRVWVRASPVKSFANRIAFYLSYMIMAILAGFLGARGRYDFVYATSPPLFVGGAALALSFLRRIPLVFEVRDLWPESAVALGELENARAISLAERLEWRCYQHAKRIVVVTGGIRDRLLARGVPEEKLILIPNGANVELFRPQPERARVLGQSLGLGNRFVVLYAGIHGIAQGLEHVVQAAELLQDVPEIHFVFVGEGPVKTKLVEQSQKLGLINVLFHSEVPREEMPAWLSLASVAIVPLRNADIFSGAVPSKIFDAWACGCPTIVAISGEAKLLTERSGAGMWVEPEDPMALSEATELLLRDDYLRRQMSENARRFVCTNYSRQVQVQQLEHTLRVAAELG